jgi:hypothetical protein
MELYIKKQNIMSQLSLIAFLLLFSTLLMKAMDFGDLLSAKNIRESISSYSNGEVRIVGGVLLKAPQGNEVYDLDLMLLARWLDRRNLLPALSELGQMLDNDNIACRVFANYGLKLKIFNLPPFNPYFPPGHQQNQIRKILSRIEVSGDNPPKQR